MGAHPVRGLPQQAPFHQPLPETTPVVVGRLEGYPGEQKAVRDPRAQHHHCTQGCRAWRGIACVAESMAELISEKLEGKILGVISQINSYTVLYNIGGRVFHKADTCCSLQGEDISLV